MCSLRNSKLNRKRERRFTGAKAYWKKGCTDKLVYVWMDGWMDGGREDRMDEWREGGRIGPDRTRTDGGGGGRMDGWRMDDR